MKYQALILIILVLITSIYFFFPKDMNEYVYLEQTNIECNVQYNSCIGFEKETSIISSTCYGLRTSPSVPNCLNDKT